LAVERLASPPGSIGELRSTVRGGYCDDFTDEQVQRLDAACKTLGFALNPFFDEAYLSYV